MNTLENELSYPFGQTMPQGSQTLVVAPGVKWIRMSLPFALNHINLWLVKDQLPSSSPNQASIQGWTAIDCGLHRPDSQAQWEDIFINELEGLPIVRVLVTHMHPDHVGSAHWLCERWEAPLWMSATDYNVARLACNGLGAMGGSHTATFFEQHGLTDPDALRSLSQRSNYFQSMVPELPSQMRRLMHDQIVKIGGQDWRCIAGYGHAPEHMALYCEDIKVLISGDMVLPRISTNVSVHEIEPESNPLRLFLDSLKAYGPLPEDTLVLPSHGLPFKGLHRRIQQLQDHHAERLAEVMSACKAQPQTAADIVPIMFKRALDLHQMTFAMGEALAHLHLLWHEGRLKRQKSEQGAWQFSAV
jgi:glyoxylase-like metal-dependent hydrolase (beta-lactamase superfamily II)